MREGRQIESEDLVSATRDARLTRGLGRSYGDSSLPAGPDDLVAASKPADRILSFNPKTGLLRAEAGLSLETIYRLFLPRGFFTPVTPGTWFVTLGGMVAADVHGKNHHVDGCFGGHVTALRMRVADGRVLECSPRRYPDLFFATIGGMGLTGHVLEVEFRLARIPSPWIWQENERVPDVDAYVVRLREESPRWPFTVGWIDCLASGASAGRGVLFKGRWAQPHEAPPHPPGPKLRLTVPFTFPSFVLAPWSVRLFNEAIYRVRGRPHRGIVHPETFFYPLDAIRHWNRIYGRRGFTQYQCVLPDPASARPFLEIVSRRGAASFLCVIKDCGPEGRGLLSFPKPGISIALDIPVRDDTQALVDALNERVIAEGGRIYLAKDAFTRAEHFRRMEPRLSRFLRVRRRWDRRGVLRSAQSVRVLGDRAA